MVSTTLLAMALQVAMTHACVMDNPKLQAAPTKTCAIIATCLSNLLHSDSAIRYKLCKADSNLHGRGQQEGLGV